MIHEIIPIRITMCWSEFIYWFVADLNIIIMHFLFLCSASGVRQFGLSRLLPSLVRHYPRNCQVFCFKERCITMQISEKGGRFETELDELGSISSFFKIILRLAAGSYLSGLPSVSHSLPLRFRWIRQTLFEILLEFFAIHPASHFWPFLGCSIR